MRDREVKEEHNKEEKKAVREWMRKKKNGQKKTRKQKAPRYRDATRYKDKRACIEVVGCMTENSQD